MVAPRTQLSVRETGLDGTAVVLTAVLLATPPKAVGAVGPANQLLDRKN